MHNTFTLHKYASCNTIHSSTDKLKICQYWLSNRMTYLLIYYMKAPPSPRQTTHTPSIRYKFTRCGWSFASYPGHCLTVHTFARSTKPRQHGWSCHIVSCALVLSNSICAPARDNRYNCALPTRDGCREMYTYVGHMWQPYLIPLYPLWPYLQSVRMVYVMLSGHRILWLAKYTTCNKLKLNSICRFVKIPYLISVHSNPGVRSGLAAVRSPT